MNGLPTRAFLHCEWHRFEKCLKRVKVAPGRPFVPCIEINAFVSFGFADQRSENTLGSTSAVDTFHEKTAFCFFLAAPLAGGAAAQPVHLAPSSWRTYASVAYSAGGDVWVNGACRDSKETYSVEADQGMQAMVGAQYQMAKDWYVQGAVGFHQDRTNGSDGNYFFTRWPLELTVYRALSPERRVGVGVRHASRARFKSEGVVQAFGTYSLKTVPGPLVEIQYFLVPLRESEPGRGASGGLSLRWVDEKFKSNGPWMVERDGQHWSLTAFAYF